VFLGRGAAPRALFRKQADFVILRAVLFQQNLERMNRGPKQLHRNNPLGFARLLSGDSKKQATKYGKR
jgi:hypothetical protein